MHPEALGRLGGPAASVPASFFGSHAIWMQAPSGGVQIPQLALQQTWPGAHVTFPQAAPSPSVASGTHTPSPSCDSQRVFVGHVMAAHGWVPDTHVPMGGHGARTHWTVLTSQ